MLPVLEEATDAFIAQRQAEGTRLATDIMAKCQFIKEQVDEIDYDLGELEEDYYELEDEDECGCGCGHHHHHRSSADDRYTDIFGHQQGDDDIFDKLNDDVD